MEGMKQPKQNIVLFVMLTHLRSYQVLFSWHVRCFVLPDYAYRDRTATVTVKLLRPDINCLNYVLATARSSHSAVSPRLFARFIAVREIPRSLSPSVDLSATWQSLIMPRSLVSTTCSRLFSSSLRPTRRRFPSRVCIECVFSDGPI